jgi:hypothetical protein
MKKIIAFDLDQLVSLNMALMDKVRSMNELAEAPYPVDRQYWLDRAATFQALIDYIDKAEWVSEPTTGEENAVKSDC